MENQSKNHPGLGTRAVWSGEGGERWAGATQVPVALSVSYGYPTVEEWLEVARGEKPGHIYGRNTNPTVAAFEEKVRDLEGAEAATSFASGMAAISNTLFALLATRPGWQGRALPSRWSAQRSPAARDLCKLPCAGNTPACVAARLEMGLQAVEIAKTYIGRLGPKTAFRHACALTVS
jgi:hypothetical protein